MCGFIFYLNKKKIAFKIKNNLKKITKLIKHRGPDYEKTFLKDNIFDWYECIYLFIFI